MLDVCDRPIVARHGMTDAVTHGVYSTEMVDVPPPKPAHLGALQGRPTGMAWSIGGSNCTVAFDVKGTICLSGPAMRLPWRPSKEKKKMFEALEHVAALESFQDGSCLSMRAQPCPAFLGRAGPYVSRFLSLLVFHPGFFVTSLHSYSLSFLDTRDLYPAALLDLHSPGPPYAGQAWVRVGASSITHTHSLYSVLWHSLLSTPFIVCPGLLDHRYILSRHRSSPST